MDFSQFKSWIKNVSEGRLDAAEEWTVPGSWWVDSGDGKDTCDRITLMRPYLSRVFSEARYGIVFVSPGCDAGSNPIHYEVVYCAASFVAPYNTPEDLVVYMPKGGWGHLGFFLEREDAQAAMKYAVDEITKEVSNALEKGIPSIYFKTSWLNGTAERGFEQSLEEDTGATYKFDYADKDDILDRDTGKPVCATPDEFIRVVRDTKNMENYALRCIQMEEAFIKDICAKIDVEACCDRTGELLLNFSEEKFEEQLRKAYTAVVDFYANGIWCCFDIMRALGEEAYPGEPLNKQTQEALMEWRSMDFVRPHVLTYVYSRLTEIMSAVNGSDCE